MTASTPRPAATVILLRGGAERIEILLVRRNPAARFMGGAWVFPGGALDGDEDARAAAVREVAEEAGVELPDRAELVTFSRWITPEAVPVRFDTLFFLAPMPDGAQARPDGAETVDARWFTPANALAAGEAGEIELVFPTIKTLEQLATFPTADAAIAGARTREVQPILPRVRGGGGEVRVVLPGEPGYED